MSKMTPMAGTPAAMIDKTPMFAPFLDAARGSTSPIPRSTVMHAPHNDGTRGSTSPIPRSSVPHAPADTARGSSVDAMPNRHGRGGTGDVGAIMPEETREAIDGDTALESS